MAILRSNVIEKHIDEKWDILALKAYEKFQIEIDEEIEFDDLSVEEKKIWKNICKEVVFTEAKFTMTLTKEHQKAYEIYSEGKFESFYVFCQDKKISEDDMAQIANKFDVDHDIGKY